MQAAEDVETMTDTEQAPQLQIPLRNSDDDNSSDNYQRLSKMEVDQDIPYEDVTQKSEGENDIETSYDPENENDYQDEMEDYSDFADSDELDESEIDSMLEQGLPKSKRLDVKSTSQQQGAPKASEKPNDYNGELIIKKLIVLEEKGGNTFEVLPGGWIQVRHSSGMPLYLHRKSRVCSMSKPYFLGTASVRKHSIPLSAIPCLSYRRALAKEERDKQILEEQTRELENQTEDSKYENSQASSVLSKCLNITISKSHSNVHTAARLDTVAEKVKQFKRKLELEKESTESEKRQKQDADHKHDSQLDSKSSEESGTSESCSKEGLTDVSKCSNPLPDNIKDGMNAGESTLKTTAPGHTAINKSVRKGGVRTFIPLAKVETARENAHLYSIPPLDLREYCRSLFRFNEVECKRFKTWSARRRHTKEQKRKQLERPTLPDNAQVIKFFDMSSCKGGDEQMVKKFNDYVFNPNGKSSVCILHEFVQHALRKQPSYTFQELENASTPYAATVMINDVPYGKGFGSSKKTAKAEAAKATLEILIPQMRGQLNGNKTDTSSDFDITEYFQQVDMNDVRISKMCTSVSEPSPYSLLLTCLQRNFGQISSNAVKFEMVPTDPAKGNPPNQFRMAAGNHSVVVTASNKREGKQLASQLLLAEIHPHITNFGAFIKMYGNGSVKSVKEKKQEEQQITTLQSKASANSPNWAILNKLRHEMLKLVEQDQEKNSEQTNASDKIPLIINITDSGEVKKDCESVSTVKSQVAESPLNESSNAPEKDVVPEKDPVAADPAASFDSERNDTTASVSSSSTENETNSETHQSIN